ncbi:hypothetical protein OJ996_13730 [Luteolibacter sp. GHJ8]|uniref:Uncharacterized protein n=1 Tax=Luteolibacter rhizosphaerae TaxID=2989719 RepID=A0ABT3G4R4_9BACT|nr:hypothetical protein [Luteolibacter rhizosphaerae]MCW1914642.1 hypothetical protein [Luteolibacter rhizosphaerae]
MFLLRALLVRIALVIVLTKAVEAETLKWFCDSQTMNLSSAGVPMDGGYRFELGVFAAGFTPTAANTAQWSANWSAAQRVVYNGTTRVFTGVYTVTSNAAPFTVGANAYVWGFGGRAGNEWILFRAPSWIWPAPNPIDPFGLDWNAKDATQVIVGNIHASGSPFLMQASAVVSSVPPSSTYAQWRNEELSGVALNGPEDDADGDGIKNLLEFVFGTRPLTLDALPPIGTTMVGGSIQLTVPRRLDRTASVALETSTGLSGWTSAISGVTVTSNGPEARILSVSVGSDSRRFFRVVFTASP